MHHNDGNNGFYQETQGPFGARGGTNYQRRMNLLNENKLSNLVHLMCPKVSPFRMSEKATSLPSLFHYPLKMSKRYLGLPRPLRTSLEAKQ